MGLNFEELNHFVFTCPPITIKVLLYQPKIKIKYKAKIFNEFLQKNIFLKGAFGIYLYSWNINCLNHPTHSFFLPNLSTSLAGLTTLAKIGRFVFLHREHEGEVKAWQGDFQRRKWNILMSIYIHVYLTDFKEKWIKSKINNYKINSNNTITKHEFKVKYEGY
jgi:hypothetical protein